MSSAAEARFRVQAPASAARAVSVVALDSASQAVVARLAARSWNRVRFFAPSALQSQPQGRAVGTRATAGLAEGRLDDVAAADLVVMVAATDGGKAQDASALGQVCSLRRVMTTTIVVHAASATDEALSKTLAQVRPWSLMVVVASDESYIEDVLRSFR